MSEVTDEFLLAALNELTANGVCNTINGVAEAIRQIAVDEVGELMDGGLEMYEAEEEPHYKTRIFQHEVLLSVANALDIGLDENEAVRLSKIDELINDLIKIKKEMK